jgi:hypothetical protein
LNKKKLILSLFLLLAASCNTSENAIQTAIVETQLASLPQEESTEPTDEENSELENRKLTAESRSATRTAQTTPDPTSTINPTSTKIPTKTPSPPAATLEPTKIPVLGDKVIDFGYALTALTLEDPATKPGMFYNPEDGTKLVAVEFIIENIAGEDVSTNVLYATIVDSEGFVYGADSGLVENGLELLDISPGEKVKGWAGFITPIDAVPAKLKYEINGYSGKVLETFLFETSGDALTDEASDEDIAPEIIFQDDFSNTSSGWDRYDGFEGVTDYDNGAYRIFVNETDSDYWANPGLNLTDVIIEVEATKIGGPDDNDFGVICRYQNDNNFYFFIISSDGYYGVGKVENGSQELISNENLMKGKPIKLGKTTNSIRAECVGNNLVLYANDKELASFTDGTFSSGDVGLIAGTFGIAGTDIHFDNFIVKRP